MIGIETYEEKVERISEKVHDAWAVEKRSQGFHAPNECESEHRKSYQVADQKKKDRFDDHFDSKTFEWCDECHSNLYPYGELPEDAKDYDRVTVRRVLEIIDEAPEEYFPEGRQYDD